MSKPEIRNSVFHEFLKSDRLSSRALGQQHVLAGAAPRPSRKRGRVSRRFAPPRTPPMNREVVFPGLNRGEFDCGRQHSHFRGRYLETTPLVDPKISSTLRQRRRKADRPRSATRRKPECRHREAPATARDPCRPQLKQTGQLKNSIKADRAGNLLAPSPPGGWNPAKRGRDGSTTPRRSDKKDGPPTKRVVETQYFWANPGNRGEGSRLLPAEAAHAGSLPGRVALSRGVGRLTSPRLAGRPQRIRLPRREGRICGWIIATRS